MRVTACISKPSHAETGRIDLVDLHIIVVTMHATAAKETCRFEIVRSIESK